MQPVRPFHFWVQRILPLVYDDSLSYYEVLCKVVCKLNEVIDTYNNIVTDVDQEINNLFAAWEKEWEGKINAKFAEQDANNQAFQTQLNITITNKFNEQDRKLNDTILDLRQDVKVGIAAMESYITAQLAAIMKILNRNNDEIKCWVKIQLEKIRQEIPEITSVIVNSPVTNERMPIQDCLNQFYNIFRYGAITMNAFDTSYITMNEFDKLRITKFQFDFYARKYIRPLKYLYMAFHPVTGEFVTHNQLLYMLFDYHKPNGLSASQYSELLITAENYDNKDITAYTYDWNGKEILGG